MTHYNYLLVAFCKADGYWDTSGYCHWSKKAYFFKEEYAISYINNLIKDLANFIYEYPNGDFDIYKIEPTGELWGDNLPEDNGLVENLINSARQMAVELKKAKEIADEEKERIEQEKEKERVKNLELKMLAELKAKHENKI